MTEAFFNKSRFAVVKLTDQVEIKPDVVFSLAVKVYDTLGDVLITSVSCSIIKAAGRDTVVLPTVLTYTEPNISGTISSIDWDGITPLQLKVVINTYHIVIINLKV